MNHRKFFQILGNIGQTINFENRTSAVSYMIYQERDHECEGFKLQFFIFFYICKGHYLKVLPENLNQSDFGKYFDFYLIFEPIYLKGIDLFLLLLIYY